jgi:tetratricopeptide (TPR) repeat protein
VIEQILQADRLLQVEQVDKARALYERVVEMDPGNAIAVVGLAQCALADGDDERAHQLAAQALTIDPENDMARRMEARLAEILAVRGQPVERPAATDMPAAETMRPLVSEPVPTPSVDETANAPEADTPTTTPATATRPVMRKSLFDRLMGR